MQNQKRLIAPLSDEKPVQQRRLGWNHSGFVFHFHRCLDKAALRRVIRGIDGVLYEPWFDTECEDKIPVGFTVRSQAPVLPHTFPEADDGFLCEIHIAVVASDDAAEERRHWFHECGHAGHYAENAFMGRLGAYHFATTSEAESFTHAVTEFPAQCSEVLCQAALAMAEEDPGLIRSGFADCLPWLHRHPDN